MDRDEEIRQRYLVNGWQEEYTETGARIFTVRLSDRILTTKLSEETKEKLQRAVDSYYKYKKPILESKKWITKIYQKVISFLNWLKKLIK